MSDPVTNVEIEDVLSSIRRLVSEDSRSAKPATRPARTDKLVLTPSLRVQDAAADTAPVKSETAPMLLTNPAPSGPESEADSDPLPLDQLLAEHAALEDTEEGADTQAPQVDDFEADLMAVADTVAEPADAPDFASLVVQDATVRDIEDSDDKDQKAGYALGILTRLVEEELNRSKAAEDAIPEETADAEEAEDSDFVEAIVDAVVEEVFEAEPTAAQPEDENDLSTHELAPPDQTLEHKIAALEALVGRRAEHIEAEAEVEEAEIEYDEPPTFVHRPAQTLSWTHHTDEDSDDAADHYPLGDDLTQDVSHSSEAGALALDEDAMRDMVTRIIRQELQGVLGERITRNVRKLVRREIHRVLMSQEFD